MALNTNAGFITSAVRSISYEGRSAFQYSTDASEENILFFWRGNFWRQLIQEATGGDALAESFVTDNRTFVRNTTASSVSIVENGFTFSIAASKCVCLDKDEANFVIAQAAARGITLTTVSYATFAANQNSTFVFYW